MTCLEKLKVEHPELFKTTEIYDWRGRAFGCPHDYGYLPKVDWNFCIETTCRDCWSRPIPEVERSNHITTLNEYQKAALRTESVNHEYPRILQGLMGLNGEAGEAIDILKKNMFHHHELEREHLVKELGDCLWYIAQSADAIGYTLEEIANINIDKLLSRYPDGFEVDKSLNRKEGDI